MIASIMSLSIVQSLNLQATKAAEAGKKDEKGKKSGRSPSAGKRSKSPGKKKGKKEADLPPSPKKDTKLKRRGDVEDTFKTIGKLKQTNPRNGLFFVLWTRYLHFSELGII